MLLDSLIEAINDRAVISFSYGGMLRIAEPHTVGESKAGNAVLWAFQLEARHLLANQATADYILLGYEWEFFNLELISNLHLTGGHFLGSM